MARVVARSAMTVGIVLIWAELVRRYPEGRMVAFDTNHQLRIRLAGLAAALGLLALLAPPTQAVTADITTDFPFPYCAWWVETSTQSTNVAEPDTNAAYWTTPFAVGESAVTIQGNFVDARYFSLQVYGSDGQPVEVADASGEMTTSLSTIADYQLSANDGASNPFETGVYADTAVGYSVDIVPYQGGEPVGATSVNTLPMPTTGDVGFVLIRTYVPNSLPFPPDVLGANVPAATSVAGAFDLEATALPNISVTTDSGSQLLPQCSSDDGARLTWSPPSGLASSAAPVLLEAITGERYKSKQREEDTTLYQDVATGAGSELNFLRTKTATTPFPNGSSAYVAAAYELKPGQAAVVFANLPTSPWNATNDGTGISDGRSVQWPVGAVPVDWNDGSPTDYQMRYLSTCTYVLAPPFPVTSVAYGCATDTELHQVRANARVTEGALGAPRMVVVTYPGEKFAATRATGPFTWLPARRANGNAIQAIAMRNMLPSSTFTKSATEVDYTQEQLTNASTMADVTSAVMGEYYPEGFICEISTLRKLGPIECAKYSSQRAACLTALEERDGQRGALLKDRAVRDCLKALRSDLGDNREFRIIRGCLIGLKTSCAHHDLRGADLSAELFKGADLRRARLAEADLTEAALERALLVHARLSGASLAGASARLADFSAADLSSINGRQADFRQAVLTQASLQGADLRGADLRGADLRGADLRGADLRGSKVSGADLRGADLTGARLARAVTSGAVVDSGSRLSSVADVLVDNSPSPVAPSRTPPSRSS